MIAVVAALAERDGKLLIARRPEDRHMGGKWEFPGGKLEKGEEPYAAALRELREETGLTAKKWDYLGAIETSPGFLTEQLYLYLARDLTPGDQQLDEGEFLEPVRMSLREAEAMALDGRIDDGKTVCVLTRARALLEKGE